MEHRWGQRVRIDLPIRIKASTFGYIRARLSDLSLSGAFIEVNTDVRILCQIQVTLAMPALPMQHSVPLDAHVVRKQDSGIGIEWAHFEQATFRALHGIAFRWRDGQHRPADSRKFSLYAAEDYCVPVTQSDISGWR